MKAYKNLIYPFAIVIAVLACEEDIIFKKAEKNSTERFKAALNIENVSEHLLSVGENINMFVTIQAAGESKKLGSIRMHTSHIETFNDNFGNSSKIEVDQGQFYLKGEAGDIIFGSYAGTGTLQDGFKLLNEKYIVKGGKGKYEGASGKLTLSQENDQIIISGKVAF